MDQKNPRDPRVSFSLGYPWKAEVTAVASPLRDPAVLVREMRLRSQEEEPQGWFTPGLGAGLVATAWIALSTSASLAVPVLGVGMRVSTLEIRLRYAREPKGKTEVGARMSLIVREEQAWLGFEVEAAG